MVMRERKRSMTVGMKQNLPGGDSAVVPPDPMPNSEVKRRSADGSVGFPHVRVGNCQASNKWKASVERQGLFAMGNWVDLQKPADHMMDTAYGRVWFFGFRSPFSARHYPMVQC